MPNRLARTVATVRLKLPRVVEPANRILVCIAICLCTAAAEATCIAPPTFSVSVTGPDANGNVTISGSWTFHNTDPNATGVVKVVDLYTSSSVYDNEAAPMRTRSTSEV